MYTHVSTSNEFTPTSLHFSTFEEIATLIFIKSTILFKVSQSQAWNRAKKHKVQGHSLRHLNSTSLHSSTTTAREEIASCLPSACGRRGSLIILTSSKSRHLYLSIYLSTNQPTQSKNAFFPSFGQSQQTQTSSSSSSSRHETHTLHSTSLRSVCGKRLHVY